MRTLPSLCSLTTPVLAWRAFVRQDVDAGVKLVQHHPRRCNGALALQLIQNAERRLVTAIPGDMHGVSHLGLQRARVEQLLQLAKPDGSVPGGGNTAHVLSNWRLRNVSTLTPDLNTRLRMCLTQKQPFNSAFRETPAMRQASAACSRTGSIISFDSEDGQQSPYEAFGPLAMEAKARRSSGASSTSSTSSTSSQHVQVERSWVARSPEVTPRAAAAQLALGAGNEDRLPAAPQSLPEAHYRALMEQIDPSFRDHVGNQLRGLESDLQNMFDNYTCFSGDQDSAAFERFIAKAEAARSPLDPVKDRYPGIQQAMDTVVQHYRDKNQHIIAREHDKCLQVRCRLLTLFSDVCDGPLAQLKDPDQFDANVEKVMNELVMEHEETLYPEGKLNHVVSASTLTLKAEMDAIRAERRAAIARPALAHEGDGPPSANAAVTAENAHEDGAAGPGAAVARDEDASSTGLRSLSRAQYEALMAEVGEADHELVHTWLQGYENNLATKFDNFVCFSGQRDIQALEAFISSEQSRLSNVPALQDAHYRDSLRHAMNAMAQRYREENQRIITDEQALCLEVRTRQLAMLTAQLEGPLAQIKEVQTFDESAGRVLAVLERLHGQALDLGGKSNSVEAASARILRAEGQAMIEARRAEIAARALTQDSTPSLLEAKQTPAGTVPEHSRARTRRTVFHQVWKQLRELTPARWTAKPAK